MRPASRWRVSCLGGAVPGRSFAARAVFVLVASIVASSTASIARADETDQRARALYDEAGELERRGQWALAEDRLRAALRLKETPHLRYALAWALENEDKLLEARTEYEVALRLAQQAGVDEVTRLATARIVEVGKKTPIVQVRIHGAFSPKSRVLVDGRAVPISGGSGTITVDPGMRRLRVERAGKPATEQTVQVRIGALRLVDLGGDDDPALGAAGETTSTQPREGSSIVPWLFVGTGVALVGSSALLFASSTSDVSTRDEKVEAWCLATSCVDGKVATRPETEEAMRLRQEADEASDRGNTKQIVGAIVGGVGIVGIAAGAYMLIRRGSQKEEPATATVRFGGAALMGGGMATSTISFSSF